MILILKIRETHKRHKKKVLKNWHKLMITKIKTFRKIGIKRELLYLVKGIYWKPTVNMLNVERLNC